MTRFPSLTPSKRALFRPPAWWGLPNSLHICITLHFPRASGKNSEFTVQLMILRYSGKRRTAAGEDPRSGLGKTFFLCGRDRQVGGRKSFLPPLLAGRQPIILHNKHTWLSCITNIPVSVRFCRLYNRAFA